MIGEDVKNVRNHIRELYDAGCIELAGYKEVGGYVRAVFRAIEAPEISDEAAKEMSVEERHDVSGAISQGILAETVCSYRNGKLDVDPVCLLWDAPYFDSLGEQEAHELMLDTYRKVKKIHGKSVNRMGESMRSGTSNRAAKTGNRPLNPRSDIPSDIDMVGR